MWILKLKIGSYLKELVLTWAWEAKCAEKLSDFIVSHYFVVMDVTENEPRVEMKSKDSLHYDRSPFDVQSEKRQLLLRFNSAKFVLNFIWFVTRLQVNVWVCNWQNISIYILLAGTFIRNSFWVPTWIFCQTIPSEEKCQLWQFNMWGPVPANHP